VLKESTLRYLEDQITSALESFRIEKNLLQAAINQRNEAER